MKFVLGITIMVALSWSSLWFTPDQQGQRLMDSGDFATAAEVFRDPMRAGIAWYRAGEFEKAEQSFARAEGSDARFNRGNCLVMRGMYEEAVQQFDAALELRPDWEPALNNRRIATIRAERVKQVGGDMGDQKIGADEIRFERNRDNAGQGTELQQEQVATDQSMQALWLRRVQTKPAAFLKSKFAFQLAESEDDEAIE